MTLDLSGAFIIPIEVVHRTQPDPLQVPAHPWGHSLCAGVTCLDFTSGPSDFGFLLKVKANERVITYLGCFLCY